MFLHVSAVDKQTNIPGLYITSDNGEFEFEWRFYNMP